MRKKLLVSFSGGLTSAYMTKWCLENLSNQYDMTVVFANTGKEREETLSFVNECDKRWNFNTVWVEADVKEGKGNGTSFKVVTYETASRKGEPFEDVIKKYGIPNVSFLHCTRELKTVPIHKYIKSLGWKKYYTAIGIRADEIDRMHPQYKKLRFIYPFISMIPTIRTDVNRYWLNQPFTLELKSFEGNCNLCYKKSDRKLLTILKHGVDSSFWWDSMEEKYGEDKYYFFRKNRSIKDLVKLSQQPFIEACDESKDIVRYTQAELFDDLDISNGCEESCEPFAINY